MAAVENVCDIWWKVYFLTLVNVLYMTLVWNSIDKSMIKN